MIKYYQSSQVFSVALIHMHVEGLLIIKINQSSQIFIIIIIMGIYSA